MAASDWELRDYDDLQDQHADGSDNDDADVESLGQHE